MATDEELIMTPPESPPTPLRRGSVIGGRQGDKFRLTVLADGLVRYEWAPDGRFEDRPSSFAYRRDRGGTDDFAVEELDDDGWIDIVTKRFRITFDTNCTSFAAHNFFCLVAGHTRSLWRYGYYKPWESLGGTARTLDRVDGRTDWGTGIMSHKGYATIDDSTTMLFEPDGFVAPRLAGEGRVDGYLFAYGHDYRDAIKAFYLISGETPVVPRWALGNWWSRYYPYSDREYVALMDDFEKHRIPLSVAVIDMDWHLVDDPRVIADGQNGWTGYSWDRKLFPHPRRFLAELHERGLKTTLNDHPADGVHRYEDLYEEFCRAVGRDPSSGEPVAFDITNRKYIRAYFEILLKPLEEDGCDFWWIDWQQGEYTKLPGVDPLWVLNHFHYQHIKSKIPQPLILSRYAGPGSHRYPIGFSGDSVVSWDSLRFQPAFTATASNIGYGWWSHDIGGHYLGAKSAELTARWVQLGVFSPIMRLHSSNTRWVTKEPWKLPTGGPQETVSDFLRLRHRLLPYLYSMNVRASEEGMPLVQPMYWECPTRHEAYRVENQFLFGASMMVLPITDPLDPKYRLAKTKGWLPPGRWVDYFTGRVYSGDREVWMSRPLNQYPVFVREGSIVVLDAAENMGNGAPLPARLEVVLAVDQDSGDACFDLHEDVQTENGETRRFTTKIEWAAETSTVTITNAPGSPKQHTQGREWNLLFLAQHGSRCTVTNAQNNAQLGRKPDERGSRFTLGSFASDEPIVVTLSGGAGGMGNENPIGQIEQILGDAEIEYALKDTIWATLTVETGKKSYRARPKNEQLQGVQALDIDDNLRHAIVELLLIDYEDPDASV